jgi:hypothetical protein
MSAYIQSRRLVFAVATILLLCGPSSAQVTATWNSSTGNWSDATKWSTNPLFPNNGNGGNNYNAVIPGGNVTLDQAITIQGLSFSGIQFNLANNLTVNSAFTWGGGTVAGAGTLQVNGGGSTAGSNIFASGGLIRFGDGTNASTFSQNQGITLYLNNSAQVVVRNNSVYEVNPVSFATQFVANQGLPGTFTVEAGGTFRKTGSLNHNINDGVTFINNGNTEVNQGTLVIPGGLSTNAGSITVVNGSISIATSAATTLANPGTVNVSATSTFSLGATSTSTLTNSGAFTLGGTLNLGPNSTPGLFSTTTLATINGTANTRATINSGGTIGGSGTINGTTLLNNGGRLSPGNSPGQIVIGGGLDVGGTLEIEISGGTGPNNSTSSGNTTPGQGFDTVGVQPPPTNLNQSTGMTVRNALTSVRLLARDVAVGSSSFWRNGEQRWTLASTTNGPIVFNTGNPGDVGGTPTLGSVPANVMLINIDAQNAPAIDYTGFGLFNFEIVTVGNAGAGQFRLDLVWTPVPEPSFYHGLGAIVLGAGYRVRRVVTRVWPSRSLCS